MLSARRHSQCTLRVYSIVLVASRTSTRNTSKADISDAIARINSVMTSVSRLMRHNSPENKVTITEHTSKPAVTHRPIAQLITPTLRHSIIISRLFFWIRSASAKVWIFRSATRTRSEIRPRRPDITFRKPAIPASKNTGATAILMSSERGVIKVSNE